MEERILRELNGNIVVEELLDQSKIEKTEAQSFPNNIVCPQSALDWHIGKSILKEELNIISSKHNQDNEKVRETVKAVVDMPVLVSFSNNSDENVWVVKIEANLKRMMELFNKRHDK